MTTNKLNLSLMVFAIFLFLGSCMKENPIPSMNPGSNPDFSPGTVTGDALGAIASTSGTGVLNQNGSYLNFNFQAKQTADGSVSGTFETYTPGKVNDIRGQIVCLSVNGSEATLSAQVRTVNPGNPWGVAADDFIYFRVKDNSSNPGSHLAQFTNLYFTGTTQLDCSQTEPQRYYAFHDIVAGDILVKQ